MSAIEQAIDRVESVLKAFQQNNQPADYDKLLEELILYLESQQAPAFDMVVEEPVKPTKTRKGKK